MSPVLSPLTQPPGNVVMGSSPPTPMEHMPPMGNGHHAVLAAPPILNKIDEGTEGGGVSSPPLSTGTMSPSRAHGVLAAAVAAAEAQRDSSGTACSTEADAERLDAHAAAGTSADVMHSDERRSTGGIGGGLSVDLACLPDHRARGLTLTSIGGSDLPTSPPNAARPPASPPPAHLADHMSCIRAQLGDGEGVTALVKKSNAATQGVVTAVEADETAAGCLSDDDVAMGVPSGTPMSPTSRLRHETYCATLDFLEALCDASSSLVAISQVQRRSVCHMYDMHAV